MVKYRVKQEQYDDTTVYRVVTEAGRLALAKRYVRAGDARRAADRLNARDEEWRREPPAPDGEEETE